MTHWTVFDSKTAETVTAEIGRNDDVVHNPSPQEDAVASAVASAPAIALLPARETGSAVVITIRPGVRAEAQYEPTGFLGVHDQLVLDQPPPRKKWWQKLLG